MASQGSRSATLVFHFVLLLALPLSFGQDSDIEDDSDSLSLLALPPYISPTAGAEKSEDSSVHMRSISLQKQYVPVNNNGKIVAYKTAYFGEIRAGNPSQAFTVVFDTGSGHVILPRTSCQSETCTKHRRYDTKASSSAQDIGYNGTPLPDDAKERDQVVVSFGTGKVTGEFVRDQICIGEGTSGCVELRVVLATEMTPDPFSFFDFDGVMGLGLDSLRLDKKFSFFGEMMAQNLRMSPMFSTFLSRREDSESTITFGGYLKERAASEMAWSPVAMPELGYWQVQIKQVRIGDTILEDCAEGDCRAILDTGTSLLGVPRQAARAMHRLLARPAPTDIPVSEIDCRQVLGQSIEFDLGHTVISLPVEDYSRPAPINMTTPQNTSSLICRSLLLPIDMKPPLGPKIFIFGEPVLRRYLTVFDLGQQRVGMALAHEPALPDGQAGGKPRSIGAPPEGSLLAGAPLPGAVATPRATEGTQVQSTAEQPQVTSVV